MGKGADKEKTMNKYFVQTPGRLIWEETFEITIGNVNRCVLCTVPPGGGRTYLCRVYGYVPPTRVDFSLPKIQNRPYLLKFYSRTGPFFDNLVSNAQLKCQNPSCFLLLFLAA